MDTEESVDVILGLTYSDDSWTGFGDAMIVDQPIADKIVKLPENAVLQNYIFAYEWGNWSEFGRMEKYIYGAVVDDQVYFNNPYNMDPTQWFKGEIKDGKVTFVCGQLIGLDPEYNRYLYLRGGTMTLSSDGYYYYSDADWLEFDYDVNTGAILQNDNISLYISPGYGQRGYNTNYDFPSFVPYVEQITSLQDPSWYAIAEEGTFENYGYSFAQVVIPAMDIDGNKLNTDNLYYRIYLDDSQTPFVFEASEYPIDLTENMTEVPYNLDGYDFYPYAPGSEIHAFFTYFSTDNLKMGVQSVYYDAAGNMYESKIIYNTNSNIDETVILENDEDVYYNLYGQKVNNPTKGIYIRNGKKVYVR